MADNIEFFSVLIVSFIGLTFSIAIERLMIPRPSLRRHWSAWTLHSGIWLLFYALFVLLLSRPWFSATAVLAFFLMLVLVNNAKFHSLREPFVWQDFDYFTDAIKYPRLYIPFLGWGKFFLAATGFATAVTIGLFLEAAAQSRFEWHGELGGIVVLLLVSLILLILGQSKEQNLFFDPKRDVVAMGLLPFLWSYAKESKNFPSSDSPLSSINLQQTDDKPLPNIIAVQSESFFDPRELFFGIKNDVLAEFDKLKADAISYGKLKVPAWGANTVRSEFAFLSALDEQQLGVHRFNPYHAVVKGWEVESLASFLKHKGYRTIAIHPYVATFYQRNHVYPKMGFDEFLDRDAFCETDYFGPYISDLAVAQKIKEVLQKSEQPVFIFAITMENHGPLHLEKVLEEDIAKLYTTPPPNGCDDLTIYLRHLCNADKMIASLHETLQLCEYPTKLCWFGDHVPIMPKVYQLFGAPKGEVDYLLWSNKRASEPTRHDLSISDLAAAILTEKN